MYLTNVLSAKICRKDAESPAGQKQKPSPKDQKLGVPLAELLKPPKSWSPQNLQSFLGRASASPRLLKRREDAAASAGPTEHQLLAEVEAERKALETRKLEMVAAMSASLLKVETETVPSRGLCWYICLHRSLARSGAIKKTFTLAEVTIACHALWTQNLFADPDSSIAFANEFADTDVALPAGYGELSVLQDSWPLVSLTAARMEAILQSRVGAKGEDAYLNTSFWPGDHEIQRFVAQAGLQVLIAVPADLDDLDGPWRLYQLPGGGEIAPELVGSLEQVDAKLVQTKAHWGFGRHPMPAESARRVADMLADLLRKFGPLDSENIGGTRKLWVQYIQSITAQAAPGEQVAEVSMTANGGQGNENLSQELNSIFFW